MFCDQISLFQNIFFEILVCQIFLCENLVEVMGIDITTWKCGWKNICAIEKNDEHAISVFKSHFVERKECQFSQLTNETQVIHFSPMIDLYRSVVKRHNHHIVINVMHLLHYIHTI